MTKPQETGYFVAISDAEVPEQYRHTFVAYRRLGIELGVREQVPLCYRVRAGFTLKTHAPQVGPCLDRFHDLQDAPLADKPTSNCLAFWVPRVVPGSTSKSVVAQMELLAELRRKRGLPAHHLSSFGSAALVAGLILAHFKATGERVPLHSFYVVTDAQLAIGRLYLGEFDEEGLSWCSWGMKMENRGGPVIGLFPLGVEALGD
ncbi:MAG: hypothetical protein A3C90_01265 [Candidatus Magasanikbacteria bacterium RIFCSPHIGHO2_02_FULL_51_14]|uniref:Uncharacterized protein n=1 Tax=Candidatus Magasanikbacteria bacterium RIFCSPHIGHO2_02_FULL_51_14 TaxID=1798683 RepID=A0A1F6MQA7_9BACT|nr:MAG: hypothetical protein A3C90_01265 [Candidatus Magasanikbacteria bacterium RIFCSPHIGHO2_02_FULL_51_14]